MLKDWYSSSLQKIVSSENKGARLCVKLEKKITTKESHLGDQSVPRSHMPENLWTNCGFITPRLGLSVWLEMSFYSPLAV